MPLNMQVFSPNTLVKVCLMYPTAYLGPLVRVREGLIGWHHSDHLRWVGHDPQWAPTVTSGVPPGKYKPVVTRAQKSLGSNQANIQSTPNEGQARDGTSNIEAGILTKPRGTRPTLLLTLHNHLHIYSTL